MAKGIHINYGGASSNSNRKGGNKGYNPNKDYAAAIKNERDPAKKLQLQKERQNKINAMNANGTNRGYTNDIYSGWSGGRYNPHKDYAAEIKRQQAQNNITEVKRLMQERQRKIDALNAANQNKWGATNSIYTNGNLGYHPNKDYAAEIKKYQNMGNHAAVQQLMAERQRKIDALNASNQNKWRASNDIYHQMPQMGSGYSKNWKDYTDGWDWEAEDLSEDDLNHRINQIVRSMRVNSAMYHASPNKEMLERENREYANQLRRLGIETAQLTPGSWYYMNRPVYAGHLYENDNGTGHYKLYDVKDRARFAAEDNLYADILLAQREKNKTKYAPIDVFDWYDEMADLQMGSIDEQTKLLQTQLTNQQSKNNAYYDDIARQAYIAMRQGQTALPQRLSAAGISGGMTESTEMGMMADYQNRLNDNEIARQQMMQDLDYQNLMAQVQGNKEKNTILSQTKTHAYEAYLQQQQYQKQQNQWQQEKEAKKEQDWFQREKWIQQQLWAEKEFEQQREQYEKNLQHQMDAKAWQRRQQEINLALKIGDYKKLQQMGYQTSYLEQTQKYTLEKLAMQAQAAQLKLQKGR